LTPCDTRAASNTMISKFSANFPACAKPDLASAAHGLRQGVLRRGWHRVPWWLVGTPGTPVWVVLHGGPGSGASATLLAPFDLNRCQVLLFDQRGCGAARPRGGRAQTGWAHLVADMEALRRTIGVDRWSVLGGSWGATLALAYARAHADRMDRLVLRGAFLWKRNDMARVFAPRLFAGQAHCVRQQAVGIGVGSVSVVLQRLRQVFHFGQVGVTCRKTLMAWQWLEQRALLAGMRSLEPTAGPIRLRLQKAQRRLWRRLGQSVPLPSDPVVLAKARVQMAVLLARRGFANHTVTQASHALTQHRVPVDWLHGRWDAVCDMAPAQAVHRALPAALSHWHTVPSGHLSVEPAMAQALRRVIQSPRERR
jgi:proline iminopeptidase